MTSAVSGPGSDRASIHVAGDRSKAATANRIGQQRRAARGIPAPLGQAQFDIRKLLSTVAHGRCAATLSLLVEVVQCRSRQRIACDLHAYAAAGVLRAAGPGFQVRLDFK
jgi:hypothetical protein